MTSKHFKCLACQKRFSSCIPYEIHIKTLKHKKREAALELIDILEVRDEPGIPSDTDRGAALLCIALATKQPGTYFCDMCDVYMGQNEVEKHNKGLQHQKKQRLKDFLRQAAANGWSCECCGIDAFYDLEAKQKHFDTKSHQEKVREVVQQEAEGFEVESESSSISDEEDQHGGDA